MRAALRLIGEKALTLHGDMGDSSMRRTAYVAVCIGLVLAFALGARDASARNYKNRQYALISYSFSIHPDVRQKLSPFDGLFPQNPDEYSRVDPVYFRLKGLCFDRMKMRFERELSLFILPLRVYGKQYNYDSEGYPSMLIEVAQRRGNAKYYLGLDVKILTSPESSAGVPGEKYRDSLLSPSDYLRPRVEITVTMYPRLGIVPSERYNSAMQWQTPIRLEPTLLDGIINSKRSYDRTTLLEVIDMGVEAIIEEIK